MKGYIDGFDWYNVEAMKYWSAPASTSDSAKKEMVRNAIFSGDYIGALKVDGYYQRLLKDEDGNCFMIARSRNTKGEVVDKYAWVPQVHSWMRRLPNGTCLLSEAYLPGNEGSKNVTSILGCLQPKAVDRQQKAPLHFHIFDCMAWDGKSLHNTHYEDRVKYLDNLPESPYVKVPHFYEGAKLWEALQVFLAEGKEGIVIMRKDAIVYNKRTPARVSIKVKQELKQTIDCIIIGANEPTKLYTGKSIETWQFWVADNTDRRLDLGNHEREYREGAPIVPVTKNYYHKWPGSLRLGLLDDKGMVHYYGDLSGITEDVLGSWRDYLGKVVEVGGMMVDGESGRIRHPKLISWRPDKDPHECTLDQINQ